MTQNTEQNVRTFRPREEQMSELSRDLESGLHCKYVEETAQTHIQEAEARGAEEQRRKDTKGQEAVAWVQPSALPCQDYPWYETELHIEKSERYSMALYTRPANVTALEALVAEMKEAEQLARADAEASKANAGWNFLTENVSSDPELPSCRLYQMFQEGDSRERIEETLTAFGIEARWDATEWDWQAPPEEMEELSADDLKKCHPRKDLTDAGWKLVDVWGTEDGEIVRMYARPISPSLTREGGV